MKELGVRDWVKGNGKRAMLFYVGCLEEW